MPGATTTITILVVEDHRVVAEGLNLVLSRQPDLAVTAIARTIAEAGAAAAHQAPDVALIDYHLPDGTGAQAAAAVRRVAPKAAILILTADTSDDAMMACIEAGVAGYVVKSEDAANIASAIRRAAAGEMLIPPATLAGLLERQKKRAHIAAEDQAVANRLTPRELAVLNLVAKGLDNHRIAEQLGISAGTARTHTQSLIEKLGAHSRLEAVLLAHRRGLVQL